MVYVFIVLLVLALLILGLGLYMAISIAYVKKRPDLKLENYESPYLDAEYSLKVRKWIDAVELKYEEIMSPYFYRIHTAVAENGDNRRWVFLLHGVTQNHKYLIDIASYYHKAGYSVIMWDSRGHGKSEGKTTTYGYYERFDVKVVVGYLRKQYGEDIKIGLHGISMGAGILLQYASCVRDDCDFYIADSPYSSFPRQVKSVVGKKLRLNGLPIKIVFKAGNFLCRVLFKFDIKKIDITAKVHRIENPVLFFVCRDDDYINPDMTKELHEAVNSEINEIVWYDDGGHAGSFYSHPDDYERKCLEFLSQHQEVSFL